MIVTENLTKSYGTNVVVDDVSIDLPEGGVVSLVGANGAGKSTVLSCMARLLDPTSGTVRLDDMDVHAHRGDELARRLSILTQTNHTTVRLTVADLVSFGRYPHSRGRMTSADHRIVRESMEYLDITDLAGRYLDELSGGQRQRAYVAMVLAQDTPYVLLDEPLNNLDLRHGVAMMRRLRRAADELGRTIILVIHDINIAAQYSDRIVAMKDGRILHDGTPEQIMCDEVLTEIFDLDVRVVRLEDRYLALYDL